MKIWCGGNRWYNQVYFGGDYEVSFLELPIYCFKLIL